MIRLFSPRTPHLSSRRTRERLVQSASSRRDSRRRGRTRWCTTRCHLWATHSGWGVLPELDPVQTLYANLMGSVVVVWAVLRIVRPLSVHGLLDGIARTLFAAWQAYALAHGAIAAAVAVLHHRGGVRPRPACAVVAELAHELVGSRSRPDRWAPARHSESVKLGLGHMHRHPHSCSCSMTAPMDYRSTGSSLRPDQKIQVKSRSWDSFKVLDGRPRETALVLGSFRRRPNGDWDFVLGGKGYTGGLEELVQGYGIDAE